MLPPLNYVSLLLHFYLPFSNTPPSLPLCKRKHAQKYKSNKGTTRTSLLLSLISNAAKLGTLTDSGLIITTHSNAAKATQGASCTLVAKSIQVHPVYSNHTTAAWDLNPFMSAIYHLSLSCMSPFTCLTDWLMLMLFTESQSKGNHYKLDELSPSVHQSDSGRQ